MPTLWYCPILCCREVSLQGRLERIHICLLLINTKESIHDLGGLISVLAVLRKFSSKLRDDHEMRLLTLKWIYSDITSDSRIRVNASSSSLFFQRHSFSWIHIIPFVLTQDCYESKCFSITGPPAVAQLTPTQHFSSRAALNELNLLFVIQLDGKKFSASVNASIVPWKHFCHVLSWKDQSWNNCIIVSQ